MDNLYDVLQIASNVDDREIKKAYVRMLRKYPPEKAPEEFKKIREAYERLSDPVSRKEYDAISNYQDEIEELCRQGEEALETEAYDIAIKVYKKILIIEPTLAFAKNKLGMALTYNNELDEAIVQFEEVIKINPKNATYYSNLGYVYRMKEDNKQAEIALQKAYELDNFNDSAISELAEVYMAQGDLQKAVLFLRQCIEKSNKNEDRFQVFIYYFKILEFYVVKNNQAKILQTLEEIEICVLEDEEVSEYVAWKLAKFAYTLYEVKLYKLAETLVEKAWSLNDGNEAIEGLYNQTKEINQSNELYQKLNEDDRIVGPLKGPIFYYLYSDESESEEELKELVNKNLEAIHTYILYEPAETIKGIEILKKDYLMLYKYREKLFEDIYTQAKDTQLTNEQWEKLKDNDSVVNYEFKRLIALWLSDDISEYERKRLFDEILSNIGNLSISTVKQSIVRIKNYYPELYNLNANTLDELKRIADESDKQNRYNESKSSTYQTSQSVYQTPEISDTSSSSENASSNSDNGGCGVIFICAIIGGFLLPGIGFFIGAFIGYKLTQ